MTKSVGEFKGEAGTIYIEKAQPGDNHRYEVWFETFCILGDGDSELEALQAAALYVANISLLVATAMNSVAKSEQQLTGTNDIS